MLPFLICCDIDGTLLTSKQSISSNTLNIINELQNNDHLFYLATGRMLLSAKQIAKSISNKTGVIASNGGVVSINKKLITHTLPIKTSLLIYKLAFCLKSE